MRVTRHPYEVDGWGVGELWVGDGARRRRPRSADAGCQPRRRHVRKRPPGAPRVSLLNASGEVAARRETALCRNCSNAPQRTFAASGSRSTDVPLDEDWATPFQAALAGALRSVPWGEVVSYGELSALAGRARAARAAGTFCAENRFSLFVPCHRVVSVGGIGGYGSLGVEYKRRLLALEGRGSMALSDDLRSELAAIAPTRGCCRLAEVSALFHSAGSDPPARPRRDRSPSRPRHLGRSRGAPSRSCASSASTPRSAPTAAARSTARRATSST